MSVGRAVRVHAHSFARDVVLLAVGTAAFGMALSLMASVPAGVQEAPEEMRAAILAPFPTMMAVDGAVLAAVYGSFRYTVDRRNGVVAQRLTVLSRAETFVARTLISAVGGAAVALMAVLGGHAALAITNCGVAVDAGAIIASAGLGALAALWGLGIGVAVEHHLVALFVAPISLTCGIILAFVWADGAAWFPLPAILAAFRFDVAQIGIPRSSALGESGAALLTGAWVVAGLSAGAWSISRRDAF